MPGSRYVVSVRHGASLSYADVRTRCEATPRLLAKGPGFVLHAIMDFVMDQYFPIVDALEDDIFNERIEKVDGLASCSPPRWRPICP
ncbi:MAG TPA: hypothetical protein VFS98_05440 [Methylomirabilota bacterium]|nr:hypothetical protein [Methylomirabilota bacterium]